MRAWWELWNVAKKCHCHPNLRPLMVLPFVLLPIKVRLDFASSLFSLAALQFHSNDLESPDSWQDASQTDCWRAGRSTVASRRVGALVSRHIVGKV